MKQWDQRPVEIRNLFNPAFCGLVLFRALCGYEEEDSHGMPFSLSLLVLPLCLHKQSREILKRANRSYLLKIIANHPELLVDFARRTNSLLPFTFEALGLMMQLSLFLENFVPNTELNRLKGEERRLKKKVEDLERRIGADDSAARLSSTLNNIAMHMSGYIAALGGEFSEFPARLDLANLTVAIDRPGRPIYMNRTGGAENHLAYHLSALLALHRFAANHNQPLPRFLLIDQPTQVYFPSEAVYAAADGSIEKTEKDADLEAVRRLFELLQRFTTEDAPGFQIIVTEHANLRDKFFQTALVESPWDKPPALVPEDWPDERPQ